MISAVINTYNEEKNIKRCLSSLLWVDEIIVVDMGSTDKTVAIVNSFKAKVFSYPYKGYVEPARNFAIEKAIYDWVLVIDADEEIPQALSRLLKEKEKIGASDYIRIPRGNMIFGKTLSHTGWWPDYQIRFFKKGTVSWSEKIHGVPFTKGVGEDLKPEKENAIIHHNYESVSEYISRMDRYTTVMSLDLINSDYKFSSRDFIQKPLHEFLNRFFANEGYKDGLHGFVLALLQAFSELTLYLKVWETKKIKEEKISLDSIEGEFKTAVKEISYWLATKKIEGVSNQTQKFFLKVKNKIGL